MLRALPAGPRFREKCRESWRDEKSGWERVFHWSVLSIWSGGVKCVLWVKLVLGEAGGSSAFFYSSVLIHLLEK